MRTRIITMAAAVCILLALAAGSGFAQTGCSLTANFDTDFVGKPGVIVKNSSALTPPYAIADPPLAQFLPNGVDRLIVAGAVVPSGFHISRGAFGYTCATDTLCIGLDTSNASTLNGVPTGAVSKAWDADGDGNPCTVTNSLLAHPGQLDPTIPGNADIPNNGLTEKYKLFFDLNRDGITDVILTAYDDGSIAGTDPTAKDFAGPCPAASPGDVIHVTLKLPNGTNLLAAPYNVQVNMVYGQDLEFSITGLSAAFPNLGSKAFCDFNVEAFADSDLDASPEASLNFGEFNFVQQINVTLTCDKTANGVKTLTIPSGGLPTTVNYSIVATNTTSVPVDIRIVDPTLGIDQTTTGVATNGQATATAQVPYGLTYCGHADIVNTATVTASVSGCCLTGTLTNTCQSSATVKFPPGLPSSFTCTQTVNGKTSLQFTGADVPVTLTYVLKATNTGQSKLDLKIEDLGTLPAGATCDQTFPVTFTNVAPGDSRQVTCTVRIVSCPGNVQFTNTEKVSGVVSADQTCAAPPSPNSTTCATTVTFSCDRKLLQGYPGNSGGSDANQGGYLGQFGDAITSVPGVLQIIPGTNWSNFVKAAQVGVPYTLKNVVLRKQTPPFIQCADVFPVRTISQQGTPNIRTWWPLMYEAPGTVWTLTIVYGTGTLFDDDGPGPHPPAYVHTETWTFKLEATLQSMKDVLELFHEIPFGLDEVPLISDEVLYPILQAKLDSIIALVQKGDLANAGLLLGDFEMEVADACIATSPAFPKPTGLGTGIAASLENPACCKLMIDAESVGFSLGIFKQAK